MIALIAVSMLPADASEIDALDRAKWIEWACLEADVARAKGDHANQLHYRGP